MPKLKIFGAKTADGFTDKKMIQKQEHTFFDSNMRSSLPGSNIVWYDACEPRLHVYGLPFYERGGAFCRLPQSMIAEVAHENPALIRLAEHTAGALLSFTTDSPSVAVRVQLGERSHLSHMAASGECGADCYIRSGTDDFVFAGAVKYDTGKNGYEYLYGSNFGRTPKDVLVYFPLYAGVRTFEIGLAADATLLAPATPFRLNGRIVVYGTSITQGACASRPGMSYVHQLGRKLGIECINMGFSGNALCEKSIARAIALMSDVRLFIIDCEANAGPAGKLGHALEEFIAVLRKNRQHIPILLVSGIRLTDSLNPQRKTGFQSYKIRQRTLAENLQGSGDAHIHFFDGETLLGEDWHECTVDGVHPTDLGFYRMANGLRQTVLRLLL